MSDSDPVTDLLSALRGSASTISSGYYQGRIHRTEGNSRDIERLKHFRLLSPDIKDSYKLRSGLRSFLNKTLNNVRLFSIGANIGDHFERLENLVAGHSIVFQEGREIDCERYEIEISEVISDISDAIDDDLKLLQALVASRFATVTTIAEKISQNNYYQKRTKRLRELLENFHFSDIAEQLEGHEELALTFKTVLADKMPTFRSQLVAILETLHQYLFEFRKIEEKTRKLRAFSLHLERNPTWSPKDWDEVAEPPIWLQCATPIALRAAPDVLSESCDEALGAIARSISSTASIRNTFARPSGKVDSDDASVVEITPDEPVIRKAVRVYFRESLAANRPISARAWWADNPTLLAGVREDIWLLRVMAEYDTKGRGSPWTLRLETTNDPSFDGNVWIHDVMLAAAETGVG